jgi:4-diphosphocytidyl-2-C-methyl-D-erythritol kinase|tara:strand:- start:3150 stop:3992 length:843 start_codon:yes stop_codon:yes gene_type:complete
MKKNLIKSYAKINLSLNVLRKEKTGFHKIQSIISFLNFYDEIYIQRINKKKHFVKFIGPFSKNLNKKNTISQLLHILDKKKFLNKKYKIQVKKNVPQQSGLGGGSMNAAFLLNYFLKKKKIQLSKKEIFYICNQIGSDVLLGLDRKNSIILNKKTIKKYNIKMALFALLVKPKIGCSTKEIYRRVKYFSKNRIKISSKMFKIQFLKYAQNDLEIPAFKLYPVLRKLKIFLSNINQVKFVRMTGSGSTIVAYFSNKKSAINGLKLIKKKFKNHWSIVSKTI